MFNIRDFFLFRRAFDAQSATERFSRNHSGPRLFRAPANTATIDKRVRRRPTGQTTGTAAEAIGATSTHAAAAAAAVDRQVARGPVPTGAFPAFSVPGGSLPTGPVSRTTFPDEQRVRSGRETVAHHRPAAGHVSANVHIAKGPVEDHAAGDGRDVRAAAAVPERQRARAVRRLLGTGTGVRFRRTASGPQGQGPDTRGRVHRVPRHGQFPAPVFVPEIHFVRQDGIRSAVRMGVHVPEGTVVRPGGRHLQLVVRTSVQQLT